MLSQHLKCCESPEVTLWQGATKDLFPPIFPGAGLPPSCILKWQRGTSSVWLPSLQRFLSITWYAINILSIPQPIWTHSPGTAIWNDMNRNSFRWKVVDLGLAKTFGEFKTCTQNFKCMFVMQGTLSVRLPSIPLPHSTLLPYTNSSILIGHRLRRMVVQTAHLLLKRQDGRQLTFVSLPWFTQSRWPSCDYNMKEGPRADQPSGIISLWFLVPSPLEPP